MSLESAKKFITQVMEDETLSKRTANKSQEEVLAVAKELGLDFTLDELKEAIDDEELNPDELDNAAGGREKMTRAQQNICPANPNGTEHNWEKYDHVEEERLFGCTMGFDCYRCTYCGRTKKKQT